MEETMFVNVVTYFQLQLKNRPKAFYLLFLRCRLFLKNCHMWFSQTSDKDFGVQFLRIASGNDIGILVINARQHKRISSLQQHLTVELGKIGYQAQGPYIM
jgi:hypothetical protein